MLNRFEVGDPKWPFMQGTKRRIITDMTKLLDQALDIARSLRCQECPATSADGASEGWLAFLTSDQPPEVLIYCPACAGREFG